MGEGWHSVPFALFPCVSGCWQVPWRVWTPGRGDSRERGLGLPLLGTRLEVPSREFRLRAFLIL